MRSLPYAVSSCGLEPVLQLMLCSMPFSIICLCFAAWEGITCGNDISGAERVVGINLSLRGLVGAVPSAWGECLVAA